MTNCSGTQYPDKILLPVKGITSHIISPVTYAHNRQANVGVKLVEFYERYSFNWIADMLLFISHQVFVEFSYGTSNNRNFFQFLISYPLSKV